MKTKTSRTKTFNTRLAAYSATATAALLVAPVADAAIQNITGLSIGLDLPGSQSFSAGPFQGAIAGTHGSQVNTTPGFNTPGVPGFPGRLPIGLPGSPGYIPGTPGTPGFPGEHIPGIRTTQWHGVANINGNIATDGGQADRLSNGINFDGLVFENRTNLLASKTNLGIGGGNFLSQSGYLAFKTVQGGHSYYGWLKVKVSNDDHGAPYRIDLVDNGDGIYGAFDQVTDASGDNFKVGDVAPVPEPSIAAIGGLGLLALGAMGVREMRRRRKA